MAVHRAAQRPRATGRHPRPGSIASRLAQAMGSLVRALGTRNVTRLTPCGAFERSVVVTLFKCLLLRGFDGLR